MFLHENNHNYNSYKFSYKLAFILFLSFLSNQKQESGLQQVGGLVKRNVSVFVVVVVYNKLCSTSKPYRTQQTFIKEFSYVIPVCIIVPCSYYVNVVLQQYRGYVEMEPDIDCPQLLPCSYQGKYNLLHLLKFTSTSPFSLHLSIIIQMYHLSLHRHAIYLLAYNIDVSISL